MQWQKVTEEMMAESQNIFLFPHNRHQLERVDSFPPCQSACCPCLAFSPTEAPYSPQRIGHSRGWLEGRREGKQIITFVVMDGN